MMRPLIALLLIVGLSSNKTVEHRNPWRREFFDNNGSSVTIGTTDAESSDITIDGITGLSSSADESYVQLEVECWSSDLTTLRGTAFISSVTSATKVKMKNLDGATSIATVDNDRWYVVGNAHGEGASSPEAWADELRVVFNSTQEFRTPIEISKKLRKAILRGERKELDRLQEQKGGAHKIQKERAFLVGRSPIGTNLDINSAETFGDASGSGTNWRTDANGNVVRTTTGIVTAIEQYGNSSGDDQNIFTVAEAAYTWDDFVDDTELIFQYAAGKHSRRAFTGKGAMSFWSKVANAGIGGNSDWKVQLGPFEKDKLGFDFRMLETPHGILQLIPTPVLDGPRNKYMVIADEENLFHAMFEAPEFRTNIKTDNAPSIQKDEFFSDEGLGITNIVAHHLIKFV